MQQMKIIMIVILLFATGCTSISPSPTPTLTMTVTANTSSTSTPAPTNTPAPISTATETPILLSCNISNGKWESKEITDQIYKTAPLLVFQVANCKIIGFELTAFPAPDELYWYPFQEVDKAIIDNIFTIKQKAFIVNDEFTINGQFDTDSASHGTIVFPKGFKVVDYILQDAVTINWTASLIK